MGDDGNTKLSKFVMSNMKTDSVAVVVGKRGTGKTVLLLDLMYHLRKKLDFGCTMTPTMDSRREFEKRCPPIASYEDFNAAVIERIMTTQKEEEKRQFKKPEHKRTPLKNIYIIVDDCMYNPKILKGKTIREVFMNGRHQNVMFILLVQHIMDLPCDVRTQVDYVFAGREPNQNQRFKLYKNLFGAVDSFQDFNVLMDNCTNNREWLVLDNRQTTNNLEDCLYWYKAKLHDDDEKYCVGQRRFWMLGHAYYKDEDEEDEDGGAAQQAQAPVEGASSKKRKAATTTSRPTKRSRLTSVAKADEEGNEIDGPMAALAAKQQEQEQEEAAAAARASRTTAMQQQQQQQIQSRQGVAYNNNNNNNRNYAATRPPPWLTQTQYPAMNLHHDNDDNDDNNCYDDDDDDANFFG